MFFRSRKPGKKCGARRALFVEPMEARRMLAVVTVNTDQDIVDPSDQLTSFREALQITNDLPGADEIVFDIAQDDPATISLEHGELELTDDVTITGPGPDLLTIDAQQKSRIFNIKEKARDVVVEGLTLTRGREFESDDAFQEGGAIRKETAGLLTLKNSAVTNNQIIGWGGGASIAAHGDVMIESSTIRGNEGGFDSYAVITATGQISVSFSTVTENSGGISASGDVTIQSSTISRNGREPGTPRRGIIWSHDGDVTVSFSTISQNSVSGVRAGGNATVDSSTISGNHGGWEWFTFAYRIAGGIFAFGDVAITASTVSGNTGGGLRAEGDVTIKSSTIVGNLGDEQAQGDRGAGVAFFGNLILENSIVAANQGGDFEFAPANAELQARIHEMCVLRGDCSEEHPQWSVSHSLIGHNRDTPLAEAPVGNPDSNGNLIGGPVGGAVDPRLGLLSDNGGPTLTHPLLADSPAIDAGDPSLVADSTQFDQRGEPYVRTELGRVDMGAYERQDLVATVVSIPSPTVQSVDAVTIEFSSPVTGVDVSDLRLTRNSNGDLLTGDELLSTTDNQTFVLSGLSTITDVPGFYTLTLVAPDSGIHATDGTPLDSNISMSWTMGRAEFGLMVDTLIDEVDGRIDDGDISLRDALAFAAPGETITFAPSLSGGTLLLSLGEIRITRNVTLDASGLTQGVVIDASGNDPTPEKHDGLGSRVLVIDDGESFIDSPVTLRGLTLTGGDVDSDGGAILTQESLSLEATSILKNSSIPTDSRGAISGSGDLTVSLSTISENVGSGIHTSGSVTILSSTISENLGNGILTSGSVDVRFSTIAKNTENGLRAFGNAVIDSSTIFENDAAGIGANGPLTVNSSTISGNNIRGKYRFSAGISAGGPLTISTSTITDNNGGVSAWGKLVSITNSIVAGNRGDLGDMHLRFPDGQCCERNLIVQHSLIGDNRDTGLPEAPVPTPDANGNLIGGPDSGVIDPRIEPLSDNGGPTLTHALLPDSPAINMGDPTAIVGVGGYPRNDQRGEPYSRIVGGRIDMGAVESRPLGDSNGDGLFDSSDLIMVFQAGKYEDEIDNNATFDEGDWNGDGDFDTSDLVLAFQAGNYMTAATPIAAVVDQLFDNDRDQLPADPADLLAVFDLEFTKTELF